MTANNIQDEKMVMVITETNNLNYTFGGYFETMRIESWYRVTPNNGSVRSHYCDALFVEQDDHQHCDNGMTHKEKKYMFIEMESPTVSHEKYLLPESVLSIVCEFLMVSVPIMFPLTLFQRLDRLPKELLSTVYDFLGVPDDDNDRFMTELAKPVTYSFDYNHIIESILLSGGYDHRNAVEWMNTLADDLYESNDTSFKRGFHAGYGNGFDAAFRRGTYYQEIDSVLRERSCEEQNDAASRYNPASSENHRYAIGYLCGKARGAYNGGRFPKLSYLESTDDSFS